MVGEGKELVEVGKAVDKSLDDVTRRMSGIANSGGNKEGNINEGRGETRLVGEGQKQIQENIILVKPPQNSLPPPPKSSFFTLGQIQPSQPSQASMK